MNIYDEVILTISLISLAIGLFGVYIYFGYKIKKLEDTVDNLYSYFIAALEPQIKRIREVVNNEIINKKEDNANTCLMPKEGRTMQIMIEIPDEEYEVIKSETYYTFPKEMKEWGLEAIRNGTPLPKGHGRLTDLDKLINFTYNTYGINSGKCITKDNKDIIDYIYNKAETIIEADTESEE